MKYEKCHPRSATLEKRNNRLEYIVSMKSGATLEVSP